MPPATPSFSVENLSGSQGNDTLVGDDGDNMLQGWKGDDVLIGGFGDDVLRGGAGADHLDGGGGYNLASYYDSNIGVTVNLATGIGMGGDAAGDTLYLVENLSGSQGNDILVGSDDRNLLNGWAGQDILTGGAEDDRFVLSAVTDSAVGAKADRITDFNHAQGDKIDLSAIDASTAIAGNQAFTFIGTGLYTHHAGELRAVNTSPGVTTIAGDVNGDGASDFHIQLTGNLALVAGDFVL